MKLRNVVSVAAVALVAAGCGNEDSCPTESPQIDALAAGCIERAGEPVNFPVRLCPTCNQTDAVCDVDLSAVRAGSGEIFLDPRVEACTPSSSCSGASCQVSPLTCAFAAPATPGTYTVIVFDPSTNQTRQSDLVVIPSGAESCVL
jgi:hypothetical protein